MPKTIGTHTHTLPQAPKTAPRPGCKAQDRVPESFKCNCHLLHTAGKQVTMPVPSQLATQEHYMRST